MKLEKQTKVTLDTDDRGMVFNMPVEGVEALINVLKHAACESNIPSRSARVACIKLLHALVPGETVSTYVKFYTQATEKLTY